jgi:signal transduction histidine kinase
VPEFANPNAGNLSFLLGMLAILTVGIYTSALVASLVSRQVVRTARLMDRVEEAWRRTRTLNEINAAVNASLDLPAVMDTAVRLAAEVMGARACSVFLLGEESRGMRSCAATGLGPAGEGQDVCGDPCPVLDDRARVGELVRIEDLSREAPFDGLDRLRERGFGAVVVAPLEAPGGPVGILHLFWAEPRRFSGEEQEFVRALAAECTTAIVNARSYRNLQELEQEKSRFVFKVAHEIKAPVAAMDTHLMFLLEGYAGPLEDRQRTAIERAGRRLSSLQALIRDLLALGAVRGRLPDQPRVERDLAAAVRDEIDRVREEADRKAITVDVSLPEAPVPYATCNDDVERVLGNLVGNAVKYTPERGTVRVALDTPPHEVRLVVEDTGIGIPDEARAHLFEEFYRAPNARVSGIEGTGLGLSLVRRIVEYYRGRIEVESAAGQGTRFTVRLPLR